MGAFASSVFRRRHCTQVWGAQILDKFWGGLGFGKSCAFVSPLS